MSVPISFVADLPRWGVRPWGLSLLEEKINVAIYSGNNVALENVLTF